jgi:hypothetical protein
MFIQVSRPFWLSGSVVPVGTVLSLPIVLAAELVHNGKATPCAAPAAATPAAPAAKAKAAAKTTSPKQPPEPTP